MGVHFLETSNPKNGFIIHRLKIYWNELPTRRRTTLMTPQLFHHREAADRIYMIMNYVKGVLLVVWNKELPRASSQCPPEAA